MKCGRILTYFTSLHNAEYSFQGVPPCPPSHSVKRVKVIHSFKNLILAYILQLCTKVDLMPK